MQIIIGLFAFIFALLQIILFFKIWEMTNDIKAIKNKYLSSGQNKNDSYAPIINSAGFNIGDLVINATTGTQMRIKEITEDGKYSCYTGGGTSHEGDFLESEIKRFNS